jgi:ferredoxin--NADP+ reductase
VSELAYRDVITEELPSNEFFGEDVRKKLIYYPTVTREPYRNRGRMTEVIESGRLFKAIGLPNLDAEADRFMVCGSPSMLKDVGALLDARGFGVSPQVGSPGHYVIERAFVER